MQNLQKREIIVIYYLKLCLKIWTNHIYKQSSLLRFFFNHKSSQKITKFIWKNVDG